MPIYIGQFHYILVHVFIVRQASSLPMSQPNRPAIQQLFGPWKGVVLDVCTGVSGTLAVEYSLNYPSADHLQDESLCGAPVGRIQ